MKFLIIGGGSMGKRRQRCLSALGHESSIYDINPRRSISAWDDKVDGHFVCVPPDKHVKVLDSLTYSRPTFVEASVIKDGLSKAMGWSVFPSATMMFHPAIKAVKEWLPAAGKISNIIYHQGQYLPQWHPYEKVSEYYVSNPATGGAREIVPFELTWITMLFGFPCSVMANYRKTIDISGAELIDDTYNILLDYRSFLATITVEAVSKKPTRQLTIVGTNGEFMTDLNEGISEQMYVDETAAFIEAAFNHTPFVNSIERDIKVLELLEKIEQSDVEGRRIKV